MKPMTLNSSSGFPKLIFGSCLLLMLILSTGFSIRNTKENSQEVCWQFYSRQNTIQKFSSDSTYALIIKNNKSCLNCYQTLSDYLRDLKNHYSIELQAVSHTDSTALSRKRNIYELTTLFPDFKAHTVTYAERWNDKTTTPELVIIKNNQFYRFAYIELFEEGFGFISMKVQTKIKTILNSE